MDIPTHTQFLNHLLENKITVISVAAQLETSRFHLGEVLKGKRPLTDSLRIKLNSILDTGFGDSPSFQ